MTEFRENYDDYEAAGVRLLEVSVDNAPIQKAWAESVGGVSFPLLADFHPKAEVAMAYGIYNDERGIAGRATFVIDAEGVVRDARTYPPGSLPDAAELLGVASGL